MSDGVLTSPGTSTIASSVSSRPDAADHIGLAMAMDANGGTSELNESPESDAVNFRNPLDDEGENFEIVETQQEKEARLKRKADALAFSNIFAPVPAGIDKERKTRKLAPPVGAKTSRMKQGSR